MRHVLLQVTQVALGNSASVLGFSAGASPDVYGARSYQRDQPRMWRVFGEGGSRHTVPPPARARAPLPGVENKRSCLSSTFAFAFVGVHGLCWVFLVLGLLVLGILSLIL